MKQRTILGEASIRGRGLHTGEDVRLAIKPAPEGHGIEFQRVDLYGKPRIKPAVGLVTDLAYNTGLASGHAKLQTVEHLLSAVYGYGVDNLLIELDASEPPVLDGSSKPYVTLLQEAEPVEQGEERRVLAIEEPISITDGNRSLIALPHDGLKITCTSSDNRGFHTQHLSIEIDAETYRSEIAPARTFSIYEDIKEILKLGKIRGGSLDSAVVLKGDKIISKEPLRFADEFVRHKILDIIGDIGLLGVFLRAHIVAVNPGHALNFRLTKSIHDRYLVDKAPAKSKPRREAERMAIAPAETELDIQRVLDILPHRYPFVMVDRVIEMASEMKLRAVKNVSINEPYFQGHFPGRPVMPGVLQIEAMAQAAGILMLRYVASEGKVAYFMSCDRVKLRRPVVPGDQLEIEVEIRKMRAKKIAAASGTCKVGGKVVSSADLMFTILDAPEEG